MTENMGILLRFYYLCYTVSESSVTEMITETEIVDSTLTETETEPMVIFKWKQYKNGNKDVQNL